MNCDAWIKNKYENLKEIKQEINGENMLIEDLIERSKYLRNFALKWQKFKDPISPLSQIIIDDNGDDIDKKEDSDMKS